MFSDLLLTPRDPYSTTAQSFFRRFTAAIEVQFGA
jgi:hypothetical protein